MIHDLKKLGEGYYWINSHVNCNKINDYTGVCSFVADYEAKYVYEIQRTSYTVGGTYYLDFIISKTINARLVQDHQMLHVTVDFVVIQAVTTHKHVRNRESNVIRLESTAAVSSLLY